MTGYHNIEKSTARPGEYTGYCNGPWNIRRGAKRTWIATKRGGAERQLFSNLEECSKWLEEHNGK